MNKELSNLEELKVYQIKNTDVYQIGAQLRNKIS